MTYTCGIWKDNMHEGVRFFQLEILCNGYRRRHSSFGITYLPSSPDLWELWPHLGIRSPNCKFTSRDPEIFTDMSEFVRYNRDMRSFDWGIFHRKSPCETSIKRVHIRGGMELYWSMVLVVTAAECWLCHLLGFDPGQLSLSSIQGQ